MNIEKDWWKSFFSGIALDLWRAVTTEEQTRAEADFIEKTLRIKPGASVLDVPCGGGRLALELASRGYTLTGVEYSTEFVEEARAKSSQRGLGINWEQRDMRDLPWDGMFGGVFCFGNSFGYLEEDENRDFLRSVSRVLKPGTRFVLETFCTELALRTFQERSWFEFGGILMLEENDYDLAHGRMNTEYTFISGSKTEKKRGSQRFYAFAELCRLFEEAGFNDPQGFGSLAQDPLGLASQRVLVVGEKR